jgi:hypothetical protein
MPLRAPNERDTGHKEAGFWDGEPEFWGWSGELLDPDPDRDTSANPLGKRVSVSWS